MKFRPLLPLVALVFAVAYACTDSSAPVRSHSLLAPTESNGDLGKPPPPPVSTVILVEVQSPGEAVFTGVFFSNGELTPDGDPIPTFDGTAWLRLDNKQPDILGFSTAAVSSNARFMARDMNFSGSGTLYIAGIAYRITDVDLFIPFEACGAEEPGVPPSPCAIIDFRAVDPAGVEHTGQALAFDRAECLEETKQGDLVFACRPEEPVP
jgi:hypothetical protein